MNNQDISDPSSYNKRDLLLLAQLLHINGLIEPDSVNVNEDKLDNIIQQWFNHKSLKLSKQLGQLNLEKIPSRAQIIELYNNLLKHYDSKNTTELANTLYYGRIEELENIIDSQRNEFRDMLQSS